MSGVEVFLDDTPGETRGVIARDGLFHHLIIQREDGVAQHRLGARSVGRVVRVDVGLRAAFVDLGAGEPLGFLPLSKTMVVREGDRIEVVVTVEPRERKGPTLSLTGPGEGAPRLIQAGPDMAQVLPRLAPGVEVQTGAAAIRAGLEAEEDAFGGGVVVADLGLDLAVQRTRALVAVDIDHMPAPGQGARNGRDRANREGLRQAARLIRLKGWGGLVVVDLAGTALAPEPVNAAARAAFDDEGAAVGPLSRFGLLQISLPWRRTPLEEIMNGGDARPTARTRAIDAVRRLRLAMLEDTTAPRFTARCAPDVAALAGPLAARLGLRAAVKVDAALRSGQAVIEEG